MTPIKPSDPDQDEDIKGQYFLHVTYQDKPHLISRIGVFSSKSLLLRKEKPEAVEHREAPSQSDAELLSLLRAYARIEGFAKSGDSIFSELGFLPGMRLAGFLESEKNNLGTLVRSRPKSDLYVTHNLDIGLIQDRLDRYRSDKRFSYAIRQSLYVGLVATFDQLLSNLYSTILRLRPNILLGLDKTVSLRDVATAEDFAAFQAKIVEDVIHEQLWKSRGDQIKWFEKFLGKKSGELAEELPSWKDFIIACERRNLYAHHDGVVTNEFLSKVANATGAAPKYEVGKRINVSRKGMQDASDSLMETYLILSQYVVRKLSKSAGQEILEEYDGIYNNAVYKQLKAQRYKSVIRLAKFGQTATFKVYDLASKMLTVNLAIACDKLGQVDKRNQTLEGVDWSGARDEFNISVAAIKGDIERVCKIIPRLKGSDLVDPEAYFSWPAFDNVRANPDFWSALEAIYGDEIKRSVVASANLNNSVSDPEPLPDEH